MREFIELQNIQSLQVKVKEINDRIAEIRERIESPKNQIISDMPRGGAKDNAIDNALVKLEKLEAIRLHYYDRIVSLWLIFEDKLKYCNIPEEHIELLKCRFMAGLSWNKCIKAMSRTYPDITWNENKVFRVYRLTMSKVHKKLDKRL